MVNARDPLVQPGILPLVPSTLELGFRQIGGVCVVELAGDLDVAAVPRLREALHELRFEHYLDVILDLRGLDFMDSTGLKTILAAAHEAREAYISFRLVPGKPGVQRIFDLTLTASQVRWLPAEELPRWVVPQGQHHLGTEGGVIAPV
jgi:anti-sigma B factor antagonist